MNGFRPVPPFLFFFGSVMKTTRFFHSLTASIALSLLFLTSAFGAFYVSPAGNDQNDGKSHEKPFLTLQKALDAISAEKTPPEDRVIYLADGFHFVSSTIQMTAEHSGTTIQAEPGARPILCGGTLLKGYWRREGDFLVADVPDADFRFLAVNGVPAERSRLPEEGRFEHESEFKSRWLSSSLGGWDVKPTDEQLLTMKYKPADLDLVDDLENVEVTLYHMWDETLLRVAGKDPEAHVLTFTSKPTHPAGAFGVKTYVVWNSRHGMKRPGQWFLDRKAGKVVYWPREGENESNIWAVAPKLETILKVQKAENVTISGIGFTGTTTPMIAGGFGANAFRGALDLSGCKHVKLDRLSVSNVSGAGIRADGSEELTLSNSHIRQTGAKGAALHGRKILVENCKIHDVGLLYPSAIALTCYPSVPRALPKGERAAEHHYGVEDAANANIRITHCEVFNTPYCGVSASGGDQTLVDSNRIHDCMRELGDGAAIYLGFGTHITMRRNFVYDMMVFRGYGASAYYIDEQGDDCTIEENLAVNVARPIHCHMTHDGIVRNNIFFGPENAEGVLSFGRNCDMQLIGNLFTSQGPLKVTQTGADPSLESFEGRTLGLSRVEKNVFYSGAGKITWHKWVKDEKKRVPDESVNQNVDAEHPQAGIVILEPKITSDPRSGRVTFQNPEEMEALGIRELDVSDAGLTQPVPEIEF